MRTQRIFAIAKRIVRQFMHDRRTFGLIFVVPIVILSLLGAIIRVETSYDVGLVNEDQGIATPLGTRRISDAIEQQIGSSSGIAWRSMSLAEARSAAAEGAIDAYLVISKDFSRKLLEQKAPAVSIVIEGSDPGASRAILGALYRNLGSVFSDRPAAEIRIEYIHGGPEFDSLDYVAPAAIAFLAFFFVFLLTSVSFLRERSQGTFERLFVSPASNIEIVVGYLLGFLVFALAQSLVVLLFVVYVLDVNLIGSIVSAFFIEILLVVGAVNLGIFLSAFARNELQVVQFIPLVIVPQAFLGGFVWPVESLPQFLRWLAQAMPMTYANEALRDIMIRGAGLMALGVDILALLVFAAAMVVLAVFSMRRGA